jgi:hypothetical protein
MLIVEIQANPAARSIGRQRLEGGDQAMGARLDPELRSRLRREPDASVRLIVGVKGDLDALAKEATRSGVVVHRRLSLIHALAIGATGRQALALARAPWVEWIEEDRMVRPLDQQTGEG